MIVLTAEQLAGFSHNERQIIGALLNRIDWLTHAIHDRAESGKPVSHYRFERKATRWALAKMGIELPPNPPIPLPSRPERPTAAEGKTP